MEENKKLGYMKFPVIPRKGKRYLFQFGTYEREYVWDELVESEDVPDSNFVWDQRLFLYKNGYRVLRWYPFSISDICAQLRFNNYNARMLYIFNKEIQDLFIELAQQVVAQPNNAKLNHPLALTITNLSKKQPLFNRISGSGEIVKFKHDEGKVIYNISDPTHTLDYICDDKDSTDIYAFVQKTVENSDKFIDVYVEIGPEYYISNQLIYLARFQQFYALFYKKKKYTKNMRLHYIDVRPNIYFVNPYAFLRKILHFLDIWEMSHDQLEKFFLEQINRKINPKLTKEWFKLEETFRNRLLNVYVRSYYDSLHSRYHIEEFITRYSRESMKDALNTGIPEIMFDFTNHRAINYNVAYFEVYLMDLYFLARMYKKHDVQLSYDPVYSKYILIYTGSYHSEIYSRVFQELGFEIAEKSTPITRNCVDISKMKQPFFS
jgi:hypothetical protein